MRKLLLKLLLISGLLISPAIVQGVTVDDDGPADFKSIQSAIDYATDGDLIEVWPGLYQENINFNGKAIIVRAVFEGSDDSSRYSYLAEFVDSWLLDANDHDFKERFDFVNDGIINLLDFAVFALRWGEYSGTVIDGSSSDVVTFNSGEDANAVLTGFTITGGGKGIYCDSSSPHITDCIVVENLNYGIHCYSSSSPRIENCTIENNGDDGLYCQSSSSSELIGCTIKQNQGDGIRLSSSEPSVRDCIISFNERGIYCSSVSSAQFTGCTISDNSDYGLYLSNSSPVLMNCVIAYNQNYGVNCSTSSPLISNCTIIGNKDRGVSDSTGETKNCIIWNNQDDLYSCSATYSCIEDGDSGTGNMAYWPYFIDMANDDYHLTSYSPCVDRGDPNSDYLSEPDGGGGRINMGAYGNTVDAVLASSDTDGDELPDDWEILYWPEDLGLSQGPMDDPDGDAMANIIEYQLGWDPTFINGLVENIRTGLLYPEIQIAISLASDGDTLVAYPGTYAGNNKFNGKALTVRSYDPNDSQIVADTIILGYGQHGVVFDGLEGPQSILEGFTITDCDRGIYCSGSSPVIRKCEIRNNSDCGIYIDSAASPLMADCSITNNSSRGIYSSGSSLIISDTLISNNPDGLYLLSSSGTIVNCTIVNNSSDGIYCGSSSSVNLEECQMSNGGYGLRLVSSSIANAVNCIISNNSSYGVHCSGGSATISSCTIVNNTGRGISESSGQISNCIFWNNGDDIYNCSATYSCIEDGDGGTGNIGYYPYFVDLTGGDYHLRSYSPCIDAGNPASDYTNEPNGGGGRVNIGAYGNAVDAVLASPDTDGDGLPDDWELLYWSEDPNLYGPMGDLDNDSLQNVVEYQIDWDPKTANTFVGSVANGTTGLTYPSINMGIACSSDGDQIIVSPGTYYENINFSKKKIYVRSTDPNNLNTIASTIINGNGSDVVIFNSKEDSNSVLDSLTITGGSRGIYCDLSSSPTINNCTISNNSSYGLYCYSSSSPAITGCTISNNSSYGLYCYSSSSPTVTNCIIANNSSYGMRCSSSSSPKITNCTIENNTNRGISADSGSPEIINNILWNNGDDLYNGLATFCCIEDGDAGLGNFNIDPIFADSNNGDYHLLQTSLCIDAGAPWSDYSQEPSPNGGRVNIGAYGNTSEAAATTDVDGDGISDEWQRYYWPSYDPNSPDPNYSPDGNPDGDDFSNWAEYLYRYDPTLVTSESIAVPYVNISPFQIDPSRGESVAIEYATNMNCDITIDITDPAGGDSTVNQLSDAVVAGVHNLSWDGKNDVNIIVPKGFYDLTITAIGTSGSTTWTSKGGSNTLPSTNSSGAVDVSGFDPYKNIPVQIDFDLSDWATIYVRVNCSTANAFPVPDQLLSPGHHTYYWDGRDGNGDIYDGTFDVYFSAPQGVHVGAVFVESISPQINNLGCNSYRIISTHNEVSTITYDLSDDANVTISIEDPDGSYFATLADEELQTAGLQTVIWDGRDDEGRYVSTEGVYSVTILAEKPGYPSISSSLVGAITVYR